MAEMDRAQAAVERARVLREHLVRTAYALHFAAADAAAQHEWRIDLVRATGAADDAAQATRWREISERAYDVVAEWDVAASSDRPAAPRPRAEGSPATSVEELADVVVEHLFSAGLHLQSVLALTSGPLTERARDAVDEIDVAIREIEQFVHHAD